MADESVNVDESEIPVSKSVKLNEDYNENGESIHENLTDLSTFTVEKVLSNNSNRKVVCLQGSFKTKPGAGVLILEKTAFEEKVLSSGDYFTEKSALTKQFHNDIYGNYECYPAVELNSVKTTLIHPATEKHIQKYSVHNLYVVDETPKIYEITLDYITKEQFDLQWVYNILEHKSESDRIVFEDTDPEIGFILLPDLKWNGTTLDNLYLLALPHKRDLKSLRDLTAAHIPLLRNIQLKATEAIRAKYNLDPSQLRVYFHYQPSFYHLHIHFTYLRFEASGITAERAHLLTNVISNLELMPDYYQKVTLPFVVNENDGLFAKFEESGILKKIDLPTCNAKDSTSPTS